jgi:hypothetical protein
MSEPPKSINVPTGDPVYSVWIWRQDSMTLARLRPVLAQLRDIPDQSCQFDKPNGCQPPGLSCMACALRHVKEQLFGPTNGATHD